MKMTQGGRWQVTDITDVEGAVKIAKSTSFWNTDSHNEAHCDVNTGSTTAEEFYTIETYDIMVLKTQWMNVCRTHLLNLLKDLATKEDVWNYPKTNVFFYHT